jgi:hypothetical protein
LAVKRGVFLAYPFPPIVPRGQMIEGLGELLAKGHAIPYHHNGPTDDCVIDDLMEHVREVTGFLDA